MLLHFILKPDIQICWHGRQQKYIQSSSWGTFREKSN